MPAISDSKKLVAKLKLLVGEERKITVEILQLLKSIDSKRIYADLGFSSLHEFCVKELGYSSGSAWRRIESMRLLKDLEKAPEIELKLLDGSLNVSVLAQVQTYIKHEKKAGKTLDQTQKENLINQCVHKSTRQVQRELVERLPTFAPKFQEKMTPLSEDKTALKIVADSELMELLEAVKKESGVVGEDWSQLIKKLARSYLAKKRSQKLSLNSSTKVLKSHPGAEAGTNHATRYVPKQIRRSVLEQSNHRCEYVSQENSRRCEAKTGLQLDHRVPFSKGGTHDPQNLQILCQAHNLYKATQDYGVEKISFYLRN